MMSDQRQKAEGTDKRKRGHSGVTWLPWIFLSHSVFPRDALVVGGIASSLA